MDSYDSYTDFSYNYDELFHDFGNAAKQPIMEKQVVQGCQDIHKTDLAKLLRQGEVLGDLSTIMSREWLKEVEAVPKVVL
jgi:hypothetical protein